MNKRILFVTHLFYPARGGVEIHIKRLSAGLAAKGYQVKVLTTNAYSTEAFFLKDKRRIDTSHEMIDGVEVERLGFRTFGKSILNFLRSVACRIKYPLNNWIRFYSFGPRNPKFLTKIMQYKPDLIYAAPLPTFNVYYAQKAAKKLNIPLLFIPSYHIHDPCSFYNSIFFRYLRDSEVVMAQSQVEKDFLTEAGGINKDRIVIFPPLPFTEQEMSNLPDRDKKQSTRQRYGITQESVVLYLGQHGVHKNISQVIKAMGFVWEQVDDTALVIAGGTTEYTSQLKDMASQLNGDGINRIYFLDNFPQEEKSRIFNLADIFISLSDFESFGIVFAEAMLHRLPVIASVHSVARSIVDDFKTGLLVNPHCDVEVAGALVEILWDKKLGIEYGLQGHQKALREYNPITILNKWDDILRSQLEEKSQA